MFTDLEPAPTAVYSDCEYRAAIQDGARFFAAVLRAQAEIDQRNAKSQAPPDAHQELQP